MASLASLRSNYHGELAQTLWGQRVRGGNAVSKNIQGTVVPVFTNADSHHATSVVLAAGTAARVGIPPTQKPGAGGSESGSLFEAATREFLTDALGLFSNVQRRNLKTLPGEAISHFSQYEHLTSIERVIEEVEELKVALGGDYIVTPDIVVAYDPLDDNTLDSSGQAFDAVHGRLSPTRAATSSSRLLHASISCKWTMRRDRAQNTRTEALNLVRNRKGRLPHIAAVTMECAPDILASLALGTGDIDCVYHGALNELLDAADDAASNLGGGYATGAGTLHSMVDGSRLRDITDLPLDLLT